jgi:hypothetical protein
VGKRINDTLGYIDGDTKYSRLLIVLGTCYAGGNIWNLQGPNRIICAASDFAELSHTAISSDNDIKDDHHAYLHHGNFLVNTFSPTPYWGFYGTMTGSYIRRVLTLHNEGIQAAQHNYWNKLGSINDGRFDPQCDDDGDGKSEQDQDFDPHYLAAATYL